MDNNNGNDNNNDNRNDNNGEQDEKKVIVMYVLYCDLYFVFQYTIILKYNYYGSSRSYIFLTIYGNGFTIHETRDTDTTET